MPKFRNIRVKMQNGKSRIQRAMVLRSGKLKFVKNVGRKAHSGAKRAHKAVKHRVSKRKNSKSRNKSPVRHNNNSKRSRSSSVVGKGIFNKIPFINNPIAKKVFIAAGAASIITSVLALVSPRAAELSNSTIGRGVIGFATGDFIGGAANILLPMLQGRSLGGNGGQNGSNGFA